MLLLFNLNLDEPGDPPDPPAPDDEKFQPVIRRSGSRRGVR